ncbi:AraC family transcriptional regulator [Roseococcus sp. SYP-B2431]|uniref:AraC family transcriptional regulator n=1 Tax=Roseococcus sp. SYP-B2431 TaxID=2496640 RepID=UPI00103B0002|nr:AraC family transcriptional regulator [Roseococcus sp. SYP-B2431]TCH96364.1 AraC family transcriptional regulator [Roseococcus sp. SYP-B2431]
MDPLSDVLRSVRLTGGLFVEARFTAPWCVTAQVRPEEWSVVLAAPVQVIAYHVVISGRLCVTVDGAPDVTVDAGEIVLFPRNDGHILASGPGQVPIGAGALIQRSPQGGLARISHGGGGEAAHLVCGFLGSGDAYNPLIASLPPVLKLDLREGTARDWIEASVRFAAAELAAGRLPTSSVVSRLSETLLVEAVRHYASALDSGETGWLKGLRDPGVGRALSLMHQDVAAPWSVDELARHVAMSRSAFVERFRALVGVPPIRYLTSWRLQTARHQLRRGGSSVGQVARAVGYESEEAFSRAFKRQSGLSPARWRNLDGAEG